MKKEELVQLIQSKKEAKIAEVSQDFDSLLEAVNSLEVETGNADVAALQAELVEVKAQLEAKNSEIEAMKALLEEVKVKLEKDESVIAKLKAILTEAIG